MGNRQKSARNPGDQLSQLPLSRFFGVPRRAKRLPCPYVLTFIMPQDVAVSVLRNHAKECRPWREPAVFHLAHLECPARQHKTQGPFVSAIARITFDADF